MTSHSPSSSEEDEEHNAALRSVAIDSNAVVQFAMPSVQSSGRKSRPSKFSCKRSANVLEDGYDNDGDRTGGPKLYQSRVQDLLQKHLDKVFEEGLEVAVESGDAAKSDDPVAEDETYDGEVRLYSNVPRGVALKRSRSLKGLQVRQLPSRYDSSDEDDAEQECRLQAASVDGSTVKSQAEIAKFNVLTRLIAAEESSQRAEKIEAERVQHLKQQRGEEWLPSISKEILKEVRKETQRRQAMSSKGKIGVVTKYNMEENLFTSKHCASTPEI